MKGNLMKKIIIASFIFTGMWLQAQTITQPKKVPECELYAQLKSAQSAEFGLIVQFNSDKTPALYKKVALSGGAKAVRTVLESSGQTIAYDPRYNSEDTGFFLIKINNFPAVLKNTEGWVSFVYESTRKRWVYWSTKGISEVFLEPKDVVLFTFKTSFDDLPPYVEGQDFVVVKNPSGMANLSLCK